MHGQSVLKGVTFISATTGVNTYESGMFVTRAKIAAQRGATERLGWWTLYIR